MPKIKKRMLQLNGGKMMDVRRLWMKGVKRRRKIIPFYHLYDIVYFSFTIVI